MKNLIIVGTFSVIASVANAAPVTCTTNVNHDPRAASTTITLNSLGRGLVQVSMSTNGGMAHFVTAPRQFTAEAKNFGPEIVEYFNAKEDFNLSVSFQPLGGQIRGTYTGEIMGRREQLPVVCVAAMN